MGRSKISVLVSLLSLAVAVGSVVTLFSVRSASSKDSSRLRASSYIQEPGTPEAALPLDPTAITYRQSAHFPLELKKVIAVAVDADDHIYVAGDKLLCKYTSAGRLEARYMLADEPTCLAVAGRQHISPGRIYVGFADHVEVYDPDGSKVAIWPGLDVNKTHFTSIATSEHDVFIADAGDNVIQHFDPTGKLLVPIGENSPGHFAPAGKSDHFDLVVGMDDLIYVVNRHDCRVEGWDFTGEMERHWGEASPKLENFAGRNNPAQIALTGDGRFVTAEEDPLRVKVYNRSGDMTGVVCGPETTGRIADLAADHKNRVLVLDSDSHCVRIFEEKAPSKEAEQK